MYPKKNLETIKKIQHADFKGQSKSQMKPLYIEQNVFDVDLDAPIYRIMELKYFYADIQEKVLTHIKACKETWGDEYENPLLQVEYTEELTGENLSLSGIVNGFYGLSWTLDDKEDHNNWGAFSYGNDAVRIKSTPRKLLNALMSLDDKFFMLHHYIGKVDYLDLADLVKYFKNTHYEYHLDSLGQGAVLSLMALQNCFSSEKEIRLLCDYDPTSCIWVRDNIIKPNGLLLCKVPVSWSQILDEVVLNPGSSEVNLKRVSDFLNENHLICPVSNSVLD